MKQDKNLEDFLVFHVKSHGNFSLLIFVKKDALPTRKVVSNQNSIFSFFFQSV